MFMCPLLLRWRCGGEPSDSGWEFAVSGMLVVTDVGDSPLSVMTVVCEVVASDSKWDFVEPQHFSFDAWFPSFIWRPGLQAGDSFENFVSSPK